jgi:hypothetical protein
VYKFYEQNIDRGKSFTYRHFAAENVSKSTLYSILQPFERGVGADRKKGTGRKAVKQQLQKVKKVFENSDSCSLRLAARKFGVSPSYLCNIPKNKTNLRFRRKQTIPKRSENQIQLAKPKCGRLMRKFSNHAFIFWSLLKGRVYARGWRAKNTTQLITRIKYCLKKITVDVVQRLSESTSKRIDIIRRNGVIEVR